MKNLRIIRPGNGLHPRYYDFLFQQKGLLRYSKRNTNELGLCIVASEQCRGGDKGTAGDGELSRIETHSCPN